MPDGEHDHPSLKTYIDDQQDRDNAKFTLVATNNAFEDCVVVSDGNPPSRQVNVAAYVWRYNTGIVCSDAKLIRVRTRFHNNNNFWNGGGCGTPTLTGSVFGDTTLNAADYKVTL